MPALNLENDFVKELNGDSPATREQTLDENNGYLASLNTKLDDIMMRFRRELLAACEDVLKNGMKEHQPRVQTAYGRRKNTSSDHLVNECLSPSEDQAALTIPVGVCEVVERSSDDNDMGGYQLRMSSASSQSCASIDEVTRDFTSGAKVVNTLPRNWPSSLTIRLCTTDESDIANTSYVDTRCFLRGSRFKSLAPNKLADQDENPSPWVINPHSHVHCLWIVLSILFLFFDLIVTPFVLAWDVFDDAAVRNSTICTCIFWSTDVAVKFFTSYYEMGEEQRHLQAIARHYFKTTFPSDFVLVGCDWVSLVVLLVSSGSSSRGGTRLIRFVKVGRMILVVVVLRMLRLLVIIQEFIEHSLSEYSRLALKILQALCITMWFNHLLTCAWFAIGKRLPSNTGKRWIDTSISDNTDYSKASWQYQYISSFLVSCPDNPWGNRHSVLQLLRARCKYSMPTTGPPIWKYAHIIALCGHGGISKHSTRTPYATKSTAALFARAAGQSPVGLYGAATAP